MQTAPELMLVCSNFEINMDKKQNEQNSALSVIVCNFNYCHGLVNRLGYFDALVAEL